MRKCSLKCPNNVKNQPHPKKKRRKMADKEERGEKNAVVRKMRHLLRVKKIHP